MYTCIVLCQETEGALKKELGIQSEADIDRLVSSSSIFQHRSANERLIRACALAFFTIRVQW